MPAVKGKNCGGARTGAGRKKGSITRWKRGLRELLIEKGELTPLDGMLAIINDPNVDPKLYLSACTAAAPYVHRRKPQAMEITGRFEYLGITERELRRRLVIEEIKAKHVDSKVVSSAPLQPSREIVLQAVSD